MTSGDTIEDAAAEWVVRAAAPDFADEDELQRFCARSPHHAEAFARAQEAWQALGTKALYASPSVDAATPAPRRKRATWGMGIAASLALAIGLASYPQLALFLRADMRTHTAQTRSERLPDGSRVTLDAESALELAYSDKERRVILLQGQALFEATPAARDGRPFIVEAEGGTVRALGTRFAVNDLGNSVDVIALEHRIEVRGSLEAAACRLVIAPGAAVRYGPDMPPRERRTSAAVGDAWRDGRLLLDRVQLSEALDVLGRYSHTPIHFWGEASQDRVISGAFRTDDIDGAIATIAGEFGLRVTRVPLLGIVLR